MFTSGDGVPINPDTVTAFVAKTNRAHNVSLPPEQRAPAVWAISRSAAPPQHLPLASVPVNAV